MGSTGKNKVWPVLDTNMPEGHPKPFKLEWAHYRDEITQVYLSEGLAATKRRMESKGFYAESVPDLANEPNQIKRMLPY